MRTLNNLLVGIVALAGVGLTNAAARALDLAPITVPLFWAAIGLAYYLVSRDWRRDADSSSD